MIAPKQIAGLRYLVFNSNDGTDLPKQVMAFLIESSEALTKGVCVVLTENREGYSAEEIQTIAGGFSGMNSSNGTTRLHAILAAMGSEFHFSCHYGDFDPTRQGDPFSPAGQFAGLPRENCSDPEVTCREGMPLRYTFWLAKDLYDRTAHLLTTNREALSLIDLKRSGLYPTLERP